MTSVTQAIHVISTTYGTWLPGDARGHWSPFINAEARVVYPLHAPLPGDADLELRARERMKHRAAILTLAEQALVADVFGEVTKRYRYSVLAAAVRSTHFHLVLGPPSDAISTVMGRLKGISSKAVRLKRGPGPIWTDGYYKVFLTNDQVVRDAVQYVERHNVERGMPGRPWAWVQAIE